MTATVPWNAALAELLLSWYLQFPEVGKVTVFCAPEAMSPPVAQLLSNSMSWCAAVSLLVNVTVPPGVMQAFVGEVPVALRW